MRIPRRRTFWISNSLDPTSVVDGGTSIVDMLAGTVPGDRLSLRRITIRRMLIDVSVDPETAFTPTLFSFGVIDMHTDSVTAGTWPDIGTDESGFYLAQEGSWTSSVLASNAGWHRQYDIRSARTLLGANRTLVFGVQNLSAVAHITIAAHFRLLVAYG